MQHPRQTTRLTQPARPLSILPIGTGLALALVGFVPCASAEPPARPAATSSPTVVAAPPAAAASPAAGDAKPVAAKADAQDPTGQDSSKQDPAKQTLSATDPRRVLAQDREAFFDAHLAGLHAGLTLTSEQQDLWPPVEAAIRALDKTRHPRQTREDIAKLLDESPSDVLRMRGEQLKQRGDAMEKLAEATAPLLDKLDDVQKSRLPFLLEGMRPGPILRAAFDVRGGRVVAEPSDAQRDGQSAGAFGDADGGRDRRQDRGPDQRPYGASQGEGYGRQGYDDAMPMRRHPDRFDTGDDDRG